MDASRIYPESRNMDASVSTIAYRGGALSSMSMEEKESYYNSMTLQEARWMGVRKKVPGMTNKPKKSSTMVEQRNSRFYDYRDPYQEQLDATRNFVRSHFHRKECYYFVPKPGQTTGSSAVKTYAELKCHCGETLSGHAALQAAPNVLTEEYMPKEYHEAFTDQNKFKRPPEVLPNVKWDPKTSIRRTDTNTFGKINFENVEQAGGKKPAKYVRIADDDSVDDLVQLMMDHWNVKKPEMPNLIISVVGGAKNFKLDGIMRETFATGLIKAAKTTSAWLITSGFNMGVMKAVGQAVQQGQSFCWDNDRMAHKLRCIGIAPWGYVKNRNLLESDDFQGKFNANYRTSNVILHKSAVPLNANHTHFIFVDDGYRIRYGGVAGIRAQLEQTLSTPTSERGLGIPVVLVVLEGGVDSINDAKTSIEHNIPVVVCNGTGRAADILAYAYSHTKWKGGQSTLKVEFENILMERIRKAYGDSWKTNDEAYTKAKEILDKVKFCCHNPDLMHVFHMKKHEDLDLAILSVILKAKKGEDEQERLSQLRLALMWDCVDIAQEQIFRDDVLWSTGSLNDILTQALLEDKVKFVELILQQGVVTMKEYLTLETLQKLYATVPSHNYLYKVMHKLVGSSDLKFENICKLAHRLLDRFDDISELVVEYDQYEDHNYSAVHFIRPYKMLLVWAVLLKRQPLAKLFWELGDEPVTSALIATRMYHCMRKNLPRHESHLKDVFKTHEDEFEVLATKVLNECHNVDPNKAMMIAERKSPCWNEMSCLQIAASATDQMFLSSVTCVSSINMVWKHGILYVWYKIVLAMLCPPFILYCLEIANPTSKKLSWYDKLLLFYNSPLSKFAYGMVFYMTFLILHSYMVLVEFDPGRRTPLEWIMIIWIFSFLVDEIHTFLQFPAASTKAKVRDWFGILKWLDIANFLLAFLGLALHGTNPEVTKVIYCINSVIFFLRIMKIYLTNGQLGPKIFMIQRMMDELRMFIMVLLVFLLAYGVSSQGLLYKDRTANWEILKQVLYYPYWQLYGEIYLEELESDDSCAADSTDCRTFHWLVPILLAMYLLVGNILLLNLLIAIFSHVFDTVEKNSIEIWKYQMYFVTMEYEKKTALVPPLSLFQHAIIFLRWLFFKLPCGNERQSKQTLGRRQLEYLQLFEKEMMMNFLRQMKEEQMTGIEMTVSKLQKRVDELTKMIEDEIIGGNMADQWDEIPYKKEEDKKKDKKSSDKHVEKKESTKQMLGPLLEVGEDEEEQKKKKKKKKKDKRKEKKIDEEAYIPRIADEEKINNINHPQNIEPQKVKEKVLPVKRDSGIKPGILLEAVSGLDSGVSDDRVTGMWHTRQPGQGHTSDRGFLQVLTLESDDDSDNSRHYMQHKLRRKNANLIRRISSQRQSDSD